MSAPGGQAAPEQEATAQSPPAEGTAKEGPAPAAVGEAGPSAAGELYAGAAKFGRVYTEVVAAIATVLALVLLVVALFLWAHAPRSVAARVARAPGPGRYAASYTAGGRAYTVQLPLKPAQRPPAEGSAVELWYAPAAPGAATAAPPLPHLPLWLAGGGLLFAALAWGNVWLTRRYKGWAAFTGAMGAANLLRV